MSFKHNNYGGEENDSINHDGEDNIPLQDSKLKHEDHDRHSKEKELKK